jgi:predicted esterase
MRTLAMALLFNLCCLSQESKPAAAKVDDSDPKNPVADLRANKDEDKRYFLIGPAKEAKVPKDGYRVLIVLPGGTGEADFMNFVRNIRREVVGDDYLVAQLVAVKWKPDQGTVWPSKLLPVPKMRFTTEEFAAEVLADVAKRHRIDRKHVFALGWSSSGHVVYSLSLAEKPIITGAYVAMAVFHPRELPPLKPAKGRAWFLDHSPDDDRCPFKDAETARDALKKAGGKVELVTYTGGHGWQDNPYERMRKGIKFLEDHVAGK